MLRSSPPPSRIRLVSRESLSLSLSLDRPVPPRAPRSAPRFRRTRRRKQAGGLPRIVDVPPRRSSASASNRMRTTSSSASSRRTSPASTGTRSSSSSTRTTSCSRTPSSTFPGPTTGRSAPAARSSSPASPCAGRTRRFATSRRRRTSTAARPPRGPLNRERDPDRSLAGGGSTRAPRPGRPRGEKYRSEDPGSSGPRTASGPCSPRSARPRRSSPSAAATTSENRRARRRGRETPGPPFATFDPRRDRRRAYQRYALEVPGAVVVDAGAALLLATHGADWTFDPADSSFTRGAAGRRARPAVVHCNSFDGAAAFAALAPFLAPGA